MLIIRTMPYSIAEMMQIISIRAEVEGMVVDDEALAAMGEIGLFLILFLMFSHLTLC